MPRTTPRFGTAISVSRVSGLLKRVASARSSGQSSTPLRRGSTLSFATKATRPLVARADRSASASSFVAAHRSISVRSCAPSRRVSATRPGRRVRRSSSALRPSIRRPRAGSPIVNRASSSPSSSSCSADWAITTCPGSSMRISPLCPVPPRALPLARAARAKLRARCAAVPRRRGVLRYADAGSPDWLGESRTLTRVGVANGSPCTWSMLRSNRSRDQRPARSL